MDLNLEKHPIGGSDFLKADALGERHEAKAKITGVREEHLRITGDTILLDLSVEGITSPMALPLNRTNRTVLAEAFGVEHLEKAWVGKEITIEKVRVQDPEKKRMVDSIGLRV